MQVTKYKNANMMLRKIHRCMRIIRAAWCRFNSDFKYWNSDKHK